MEKAEVIEFFDRRAAGWDAAMRRNEESIAAIMDHAGVRPGVRVLDVACGTGVLFPDYLERGAASVTGIDISPEMVRIARGKFPHVETICGDVETAELFGAFDVVMVYNAFPHFPDPHRLIERLAQLVIPGGTLSVAHGMSRGMVARHHARQAQKVSIELPAAAQLAKLFAPFFQVTAVIDNDEMYQVAGVRR